MTIRSCPKNTHEEVLQAIATASSLVLSAKDAEQTIPQALQTIGEAAGQDRACVFECHDDPATGESRISLRYAWVRPETPPSASLAAPSDGQVRALAPRWREALGRGEIICGTVQGLPAGERQHLEAQGVASILALPIRVEERFWGFIRFDDTRTDRAWDATARAILGVTASAIGAALMRKRAEAAHDRLLAAFEQVGETIVITDANGIIRYVNPAFAKITGYTPAEAVGQHVRLLKSGAHEAAFYRELWSTIARGDTWQGRFVNRRKDGTLYTEDATLSPVRDPSGRIVNYVAVKRDISQHLRDAEEKLKLQAQLGQAQKLDSIGRLAGGVAHDFNNMLQTILGYTELALESCEPSGPLHDDLTEILKAAHRSADLTRQLLTFARKQTITPKTFDINTAITGMLKMLKRLLGEDINLKWIPGVASASVRMDPSQLDQILANLTVNARDALNGAGTLTIASRKITLTPPPDGMADVAPGPYVVLTVSDTGCGMNKETLDHLFEPFFTTKPRGAGAGLGLATVYGIIKQNAGFITVDSKPGQGTTFDVYLPPAPSDAPAEQDQATDEPCVGGSETLLVVEDEKAISVTICRFLRSLGYKVIAATSPEEALNQADAYPGAIDLLVTDVVMPGMNGRDLACLLTARRPSLTCLFMSGYTEDIIAHRGVIDDGFFFLPKPFSKADLAKKIRSVLNR